jgi:hypothetical protein
MLFGKSFRLNKNVLGLETMDGKQVAETVPSGAVVYVTEVAAADDRMINVQWLERSFAMFSVDVQECGEEIVTEQCGAEPTGKVSVAERKILRARC